MQTTAKTTVFTELRASLHVVVGCIAVSGRKHRHPTSTASKNGCPRKWKSIRRKPETIEFLAYDGPGTSGSISSGCLGVEELGVYRDKRGCIETEVSE